MTDPPPSSLERPSAESNPIGLVGFVLSILGLATVITFPIGLVVSLLGLRREPRGFAIAGTALGAFGTAAMAGAVLLYGVLLWSCLAGGVQGPAGGSRRVETQHAVDDAQWRIQAHYDQYGALPSAAEGAALIDDLYDGWNRLLRYELAGDGDYQLRSAGPDGLMDTDDDIIAEGYLVLDEEDDDAEGDDAGGKDADEGDRAERSMPPRTAPVAN